MLSSRNKPGYLRAARAKVNELWEQQSALADQEYDGANVGKQMELIEKEIHKAEKEFDRLYRVWQNYLAKKLEIAKANHESIVADIPIAIEIGEEMVANQL